jgi:hypothetical protein
MPIPCRRRTGIYDRLIGELVWLIWHYVKCHATKVANRYSLKVERWLGGEIFCVEYLFVGDKVFVIGEQVREIFCAHK